jgi:hypothetical protein
MSHYLIELAENKGAIYAVNYSTVKYLMQVSGATNHVISTALGKSHSYFHSYMKSRLIDGKLYLTKPMLNRICDFFKVDKGLLLAESPSFSVALGFTYTGENNELKSGSISLGGYNG